MIRHDCRQEVNEEVFQYLIRAQELNTRLDHDEEKISETLFNAMLLNVLPPRYQLFVVQESFNPTITSTKLKTRRKNYEKHRGCP